MCCILWGVPVLPMIKIGRQSVGGQRQPNNSVEFPEESFIWFDCDISYKGYWSDVARIIISKHSQYKYQKNIIYYIKHNERLFKTPTRNEGFRSI